MKPGPVDLPSIWRGQEWLPVVLKWKDKEGNPVNLTGWTPYAQTRNLNLNAVVTDAEEGVTQMSMTNEQTFTCRRGIEPWDWIWVDPNGKVYPPILSGEVEIKESVTVIPTAEPIPT